MKKLMLLLAAVMIFISANFAYALPQFWFSGYAQDNTGAVLYSTTLPVIVTIYEGDTQVFTETHAAVAINEFGMFQVKVGSVGAGLGAITIKANTKIRLTVNGVICNPGSVLTQDIVNYSIMPGAITLTNGKMLVGDALNQAAEVSMGGDATITNTGVLTLAAGSVETSNIIDANVTGAKLENYGPGAATYGDATNFPLVTLDAKGRVSNITTSPIPAEVDGIIGNEVTDAANTTLTRTGLGTTVSPYKLELNLGNLNTWTGTQTFQDIIVDMGIIEGTDIGQFTPGLGTFTTLGATTSNLGNVASGTWNGTNIALSKIATGAANQFLVNAAGTNSWAGLNLTANFIGNAVGTALDLSNTGVVANTYGDATNVPQITVDAKGRITGVTNVAITHPAEVDPVWVAAEPNYANLGQAEVITGNWDNTANPWADNEVANNLTIVAGTVDNSVIGGVTPAAGTFTTLTATTSNLGTVATGVWNGTPIVSAYIADGTIVDADVNAAAAIGHAKLAMAGWLGVNSITTLGTITTGTWNATPIVSAYIADGTIVDADIANTTITNAKLVNSSINFTSTGSTLTVPASIALGGTGNFEINLNTANAWVGVQSGNITANLVTTAAGTSIVTAINDGATAGTINTNRLNTTVVLETENPAVVTDIDGTFATGFTIQSGVVTSGKIADGTIVDADVNAAAAIAYSKLNLTGSIVNADVNAAAAIAYSKLNLAGSIVNADVAAGANISYSKLNLANSIVTGDIALSTILPADVDLTAAGWIFSNADSRVSNLTGGVANAIPYQSAANTTAFLGAPSNGQILTATTGVLGWTNTLTADNAGASTLKIRNTNNAGQAIGLEVELAASSAKPTLSVSANGGNGAGLYVTNDQTPNGGLLNGFIASFANSGNNNNNGIYVTNDGTASTSYTGYVASFVNGGLNNNLGIFATADGATPSNVPTSAQFKAATTGVDAMHARANGGKAGYFLNTNATQGQAIYAENNGGSNTAVVQVNNTSTSNASTAIKIGDGVNPGGGRVILGYEEVTAIADLANAGYASVINYSDNTDLAIIAGELPGSAVNGQIIYLVNTTGAGITVLGKAVANGEMVTLVYAGAWRVSQ